MDRDELKKDLLTQQDYSCIYCDKPLTSRGDRSFDHIVPGFNHVGNFALACCKCNSHKSAFFLCDQIPSKIEEELVYRSLILQLHVLRTFIHPILELTSD